MRIGQLVDLVMALLVELNNKLRACFTLWSKTHRFNAGVLEFGLLLGGSAVWQGYLQRQTILMHLVGNGLGAIQNYAYPSRTHAATQIRHRCSAGQSR